MVDRDDIISMGSITRMAREADLIETVKRHEDGTVTVHVPNLSNLQRFATLVAAAEREKKEWVGLTEAEKLDILDAELTTQNTEHFALVQAIEAKLKEKNNG